MVLSDVNVSSTDAFVIIRGAGERTLELCRRAVAAQMPAERIRVVSARPFEETLRRSYALGVELGARWTVTIDADVVVVRGAVEAMLAAAEAMPAHCFEIEGLVFDKLTGFYRKAGQRVYRTGFLPKALPLIPAAGAELRPETVTIARMNALGHPSQEARYVVGVHDFEQRFSDVYRKAFLHARKHQQWLPALFTRWKNLASTDTDFSAALRGACDGLLADRPAPLDVEAHASTFPEILRSLGLAEKPDLVVSEFDDDFAGRILAAVGPPDAHNCDGRFESESTWRSVQSSWGNRQFATAARLFIGGGVHRCGAALSRLGNQIKGTTKGR